jgi:hypothetical protein
MAKAVLQRFRRIPIWLRVLGGAILVVLACGILIYGITIAYSLVLWSLVTRPFPCVDGGPGSPAIFRNAGTHLFTFPESASNIESECTAWQSASIQVWFEMDKNDLDPFIDSMRWDVRPLITTSEPPTFGKPQRNATYLYGEYEEYPEGGYVWIDTSSEPYRVFVDIWLD